MLGMGRALDDLAGGWHFSQLLATSVGCSAKVWGLRGQRGANRYGLLENLQNGANWCCLAIARPRGIVSECNVTLEENLQIFLKERGRLRHRRT